MKDMPGPRSTPPSSAHERHDPLLIAQLVAGDPLEQGPRQDAQRFVATCPACSALAADLAAVSRAVAWEPIPRRRRDFRFDAQRAAELRGSRLQRFLRRLSLPQSAALRPIAAGVMSVGLLFIVAGAVWPQGSQVAAPVAAPAAPLATAAPVASPAPMLRMEVPAADTAPVGGAMPGEADDQADAARDVANVTDEGTDVAEEAAAGVAEETSPGVAELSTVDAFAMDAAPSTDKVAEAAPEAQAGVAAEDRSARAKAMPSETVASAVAEALAATEQRAPSATATPAAQAPIAAPTPAPTSPDLELPAAMIAPEATTSAAEAEALTGDEASGRLAPVEDGSGIEGILVIVGAALAVAGGSLLLLVWLGRRAADPLLR